MRIDNSGAYPIILTGQSRDGVMIDMKDMNKFLANSDALALNMLNARSKKSSIKEHATGREFQIMSDIDAAYERANSSISKAQDGYNSTLQKFRSTIKNDLSSISSSADKTVKEADKLNAVYKTAIDTLTSDNMERAILNAERLAAALQTLSQVEKSSIKFDLDNG